MLVRAAIVAALVLASVSSGHAEVSASRRAAAIAAAIIPGFVVHGAGAYVAGDKRTAKKLLESELIFGASIAAGGIPIKLAGASGYIVEPEIPLLIFGASGFLAGWFSDIWVAAGGSPHGERSPDPRLTIETGVVYQHDAYRERGMARAAATVVVDRVGVGILGLVDAENRARLGELSARVRLHEGPGGYVDVRGAARYQRDDPDDVSLVTSEASLGGRLDLAWIDDSLRGTFAEFSTGIGIQRATYAAGPSDWNSVLLGTFGWGVYLGADSEVSMFYDHRRDSLAGGLAAWRAAGFVGSFGANLVLHVAPAWAVHAQFEVGNAYVTTVGLQYRGGTR